MEADRHKHGEAYWHRIHQVPGVDVCPNHHTKIEDSIVSLKHKDPRKYIVAENAIQPTVSWRVDDHDQDQRELLNIATDSTWLLESLGFYIDFQKLTRRYEDAIEQRGLKFANGKINRRSLLGAMTEHLSDALLSELGCTITNSNNNWPTRLLGANGNPIPRQPLYHILMAHFLGFSLPQMVDGILSEY